MVRKIEVTKKLAQQMLPARRYDSSKRDYGSLLIIAGTEGMMGAAVLCTRAAFRSGAGLVTLCCPPALFTIPQTAVPEAMCVPRQMSVLTEEYLNRFTTIAFGPGFTDPSGKEILSRILDVFQGTLVIDASGLDFLHELEEQNRNRPRSCRLIVTPHCAEASRLLDTSYASVKDNREAAAAEIAQKYRAVSLVKGPRTRIAASSPDNTPSDFPDSLFINTTGNSGMATGGAGDVLTGIIAGLAAQLAVSGFADETQNGKVDPVAAAAVLGAFLHGLAGDLAAEELGRYSLTAGDLVAYLPRAFLKLLA